jgi:hypothetical protein
VLDSGSLLEISVPVNRGGGVFADAIDYHSGQVLHIRGRSGDLNGDHSIDLPFQTRVTAGSASS